MDVSRFVDTRFTATDLATGPMLALQRTADGVGGALHRATSMLNPMNVALAGLGSGLTLAGIMKLGGEFENTSQTIAGFMTAMGFSSNFNQGLELADRTMRSINAAAAALPGEAEDYVAVFKAGLPVLQRALPGGSLEDITKFSNRYTAVMTSLQVDSAQAARDMALMLRSGVGGAGLDVRSFTSLLPFLHQIKGQADLNAQSFNRMTETKRVELLSKAFDMLQPRIDAASNSWDAMSGALTSNIKLIMRLGTAPLFEGMKSGVSTVNELLADSEGQLTRVGQAFVNVGNAVSTTLVEAIQAIPDTLMEVDEAFDGLTKKLGVVFNDLVSIGQEVGEDLSARTESVQGPAIEVGTGAAAGALFGPAGMAVGAVFGALAGDVEAFDAVLVGAVGMVDILSGAIGPLYTATLTIATLFGDMVAGILPGLLDGINMVLGPLVQFGGGIVDVASVVFANLRPALVALWGAFGNLLSAIGSVIGPALSILGYGVLTVYTWLADHLTPVIETIVDWFSRLINRVAEFYRALGRLLGGYAEELGAGGAGGDKRIQSDFLDSLAHLGDKIKSVASGVEANVPKVSPSHASGKRGGAHVTQDFRYSQFKIDQTFDKEHDPDRIVAATMKKIGQQGLQKLNSGLEPLYGF